MTDDDWTRGKHRSKALHLSNSAAVKRESPYPDHEEVYGLFAEAQVHALLSLSAPVDAAPAPDTAKPAEPSQKPVLGLLADTYRYAGVEYDFDTKYRDVNGDGWRFFDRLVCGMPRMLCGDIDLCTLPEIVLTWGPLMPTRDADPVPGPSVTGPECETCNACHDQP